MSKKPAGQDKKVMTIDVNDPDSSRGALKTVGGSRSDHWNNNLLNQAANTLWIKHSDKKTRETQYKATMSALVGIAPKDEIEGMIAAQLIAAHNAAMECYRRAMHSEQTFEGRRENLNQANKLSRSYAVLLEALNRHRGKGQQKVTVEHVHVHSGGQAVVGVVETPIARSSKSEEHSAKQIADAPQPAMRSPNAEREPLPITSDAERSMSNARRQVTGSPEGE
jgi:ATP-dependent Clp protease adapter protein ClpS